MSILDIVLGIFLAYGLYKGFKNGLFVELAAIVALIAGIYGAIHFSYLVSDYLSQNLDWNERYLKIAAFLITFLLILFVVHLAGRLLTKIANIALLGTLNRIAGGIFGAVKVAVILGALLLFFEKATTSLGLFGPETRANSIFYQPLVDIGAFIFESIIVQKV